MFLVNIDNNVELNNSMYYLKMNVEVISNKFLDSNVLIKSSCLLLPKLCSLGIPNINQGGFGNTMFTIIDSDWNNIKHNKLI